MGFEIYDFGIFLGKKILESIFWGSLILKGIFWGQKIHSKKVVTIVSATDMTSTLILVLKQ